MEHARDLASLLAHFPPLGSFGCCWRLAYPQSETAVKGNTMGDISNGGEQVPFMSEGLLPFGCSASAREATRLVTELNKQQRSPTEQSHPQGGKVVSRGPDREGLQKLVPFRLWGQGRLAEKGTQTFCGVTCKATSKIPWRPSGDPPFPASPPPPGHTKLVPGQNNRDGHNAGTRCPVKHFLI